MFVFSILNFLQKRSSYSSFGKYRFSKPTVTVLTMELS